MERLAEEIRRRAGEAGPRLTALRRHLHRHPEPAWGEYLTASLVARALQNAGFRLTLGANALRPSARPRQPEAAFCTAQSGRALNEGADPTLVACMAGGLTGLWGDLDLDSPGTPEDERGPLVAFRFDMDANAGITEATDKDHFPAAQGFASCHAGCMHACGHDGHVALGVELARLLGGLRDELSRHLSGRIRLIFQPAEEEGEGAPGMVAAGAVDGVRALFGLHLSMQASRSGDLVCGTDKFLATTNFEVFFTGQSAHAGLAPHEGRNALLAACTAVTNLLAIARHGQGASRINVGEMHVNERPGCAARPAARTGTSTATCWPRPGAWWTARRACTAAAAASFARATARAPCPAPNWWIWWNARPGTWAASAKCAARPTSGHRKTLAGS